MILGPRALRMFRVVPGVRAHPGLPAVPSDPPHRCAQVSRTDLVGLEVLMVHWVRVDLVSLGLLVHQTLPVVLWKQNLLVYIYKHHFYAELHS